MNRLIIKIVVFVVVVVAAGQAYNFDDTAFNQILAGDLEDFHSYLSNPSVHPRNRRDEEAVNNVDKCRPRKKKLCCADSVMEAIHSKDREVRRECFKEITGKDKEPKSEFDPFRCDKVDKHRKEITCVFKCVGEKMDVLDKDGNPKDTEFAAFIKDSMAKETWLSSIQDKVISTCLTEAKNATSNHDASDTESCNPAGVKLAHCLFREIQLSCPDDQIKDQKSCSRIRDKIRKHDFFQPPALFPNDE